MKSEIPLIEAARNMHREAIAEVFNLYSSALYNYALRLTNDPLKADHIVGDVFAKLLDEWAVGSGPTTNLRSYLYEQTYHLIIDQARRSHREAPLEVIDFAQDKEYSVLGNLENRMLFDAVIAAIRNKLTDDQRNVIILRFLEGFSLRETADIMGKEIYNIKVIQNRGVAKLRKTLSYNTDAAVESNLSQLRTATSVSNTSSPTVQDLFERVRSKLAGDGTTDAPPPEKKKKNQGK